MPRLTREQRRNKHAELVCRELRYQIVKFGQIGDWSALERHFNAWMRNAKKNKYDRP